MFHSGDITRVIVSTHNDGVGIVATLYQHDGGVTPFPGRPFAQVLLHPEELQEALEEMTAPTDGLRQSLPDATNQG